MASDTIARVNYFDRQFLRTQDFVDEQAYHIAMRRRHNIAQHRWGIVAGLQLVLDEQNLFAGAAREALTDAGLPTDLALRTGMSLRHILVC